MQTRSGRCKAAGILSGSVSGAGGVAGARAGGQGRGARSAHPTSISRQLALASRTEKKKLTSTPEVPGPSRSWNPATAAPNSPLDFRVRLTSESKLDDSGWTSGAVPGAPDACTSGKLLFSFSRGGGGWSDGLICSTQPDFFCLHASHHSEGGFL